VRDSTGGHGWHPVSPAIPLGSKAVPTLTLSCAAPDLLNADWE